MEERIAKLFADLDKVPEDKWKVPACKGKYTELLTK
jgi:hypothetical protein